ncbi:MAG: hypothetical protein SFY66_28505 [Oculatellaceae cyanobacterium bins.114]|nr:hypothetical protein [Oculatellaceae cyanobacterium bins.114]
MSDLVVLHDSVMGGFGLRNCDRFSIALVRKLTAKAMAQILMLGTLADLPPPHRMWLWLYTDFST